MNLYRIHFRCAAFLLLSWASSGVLLSAVNPARADNSIKGPERWEKVIQQFESMDAAKAPVNGEVLLIGGSNARRWKDVDDHFSDNEVLNRGFGGARLYEILHYFDRLVLPHKPKTIILNAGGNDINAGRTPEQVKETARAFMEKVHVTLPDSKVLYIGLPHVLRAKERPEMLPMLHRFNNAIGELAEEIDGLEFIDIYPAFLDEDGQPRTDLFVQDGVHFTAEAYAIIAEMLREKL